MFRQFLTRRRARRHGHYVAYQQHEFTHAWDAWVSCPAERCPDRPMPVPARLRLSSSLQSHLRRASGMPAFEEVARRG